MQPENKHALYHQIIKMSLTQSPYTMKHEGCIQGSTKYITNCYKLVIKTVHCFTYNVTKIKLPNTVKRAQ